MLTFSPPLPPFSFSFTFSLDAERSLLRTLHCTSMALPSFISATIPQSLVPSFQQVSILLAFFSFSFIALAVRFTVIIISRPKHFRVPSGLATFARFFYANFLKPHNGDGAITGQQAALESFYKAQVVSPLATLDHILNKSRGHIVLQHVHHDILLHLSSLNPLSPVEQAKMICRRPMSTMQHERDFSEVEKICWGWSLHN